MYFVITSAVTLPPTVRAKYPIFPKLPAPQVLSNLRKLLPNLLDADRLEQSDHLPNRVLRGKTHKQMHVILVHLQFLNLKPMMPRNLMK